MRLDRYLATVTDLSRSDAKREIKFGRVSVGGQVVVDAAAQVDEHAAVKWQGRVLRSAVRRYFMLHKPAGYVSANKAREHLTVIDLLDEDNLEQLHIAGRLDIDTTGLLLLSDDGQWTHRVTSPRSQCSKIYYVETALPISEDTAIAFADGIKLKGEIRPTKPAQLVLLNEHTARVTLSEGKFHQVKRMFAAMGNKVSLLHREQIGHIRLDDNLAPGEYRPLTDAEVNSL